MSNTPETEGGESAKTTAQVVRLVDFQKAAVPVDAVGSNAKEAEDEFKQYYLGQNDGPSIIEPPYNLRSLDKLIQHNNTLSPCIEAMVTNTDGTGFEFKRDDDTAETAEDDANIKYLWDFFNEPWPGESFVTQRKKLRRDIKSVGNGYLEVIRNGVGDIVFSRQVDAKTIRLVALDEPVPVKVKVRRRGAEVTLTLMKRERRYAQKLEGKTLTYFKDFGSSRDLDKETGKWSAAGQRLPLAKRASELIHFTDLPDSHTPYGVPSWISQLPSVLGSRKAEEFNNDFFDNGGVPPVMILLQGGILAGETRRVFEQKTSGAASKTNRVQVIEVEPSGGSLDKTTTARVTVERFGAERQNDGMFDKYDDKCELRIRRAFRLPPIFIGAAQDYSFATAFASYTVAEAQVFKPDRDEFDEIMTVRLLPAMGFKGYRMISNPLAIADASNQMKGIEIAQTLNAVEPADMIEEINNAAGTHLKVSKSAPTLEEAKAAEQAERDANIAVLNAKANPPGAGQPATSAAPTPSKAPPSGSKTPLPVSKSEGVIALAIDMMEAVRKRDAAGIIRNHELVKSLSASEAEEFRETITTLQFVNPMVDMEGLAEIAGCTVAVIAANRVSKDECGCGVKH